jgi:hypothetical protein
MVALAFAGVFGRPLGVRSVLFADRPRPSDATSPNRSSTGLSAVSGSSADPQLARDASPDGRIAKALRPDRHQARADVE